MRRLIRDPVAWLFAVMLFTGLVVGMLLAGCSAINPLCFANCHQVTCAYCAGGVSSTRFDR